MLPPPVSAKRPLSWLKPRKDNREVKRDQTLKELRDSIELLGLLNPLIALDDGTLLCGYHRKACLEDLKVAEVAVSIYPSTISEADQVILMGVDNLNRKDLSMPEQSGLCRQLELVGMARAEIAKAVSKSAGWVTKTLAVYECPPEAQDAFFERNALTHEQCYKISKSDQPLVTMRMFLGEKGTEPEETPCVAVEEESDKSLKKSAKPALAKIVLPNGSLVVQGARDMATLIALMKDAVKSAERAQGDGLQLKSYLMALRDKSKSAPKPKRIKAATSKNGD